MSREAASPPATSSSVGTSAGVARKREKEKAYSQRHTRRCRALDCMRLKDGRRGVGRGDLVHRSVTYTLASPSVQMSAARTRVHESSLALDRALSHRARLHLAW